MAVVSDSNWEDVVEMILAATAVIQAETLYFHSSEILHAWQWVNNDDRLPLRVMYPGKGLFQKYTPAYTEL